MRERINDKSRLEHILNSIETIQSNKDRFTNIEKDRHSMNDGLCMLRRDSLRLK